ncbi:MAG: hypothetical protein IPO09_17275 [Anaeromyxobacter sp.]|nr:hypothetical protein [Anaeromyxobacter sp.]MBL0276547.1 hypothetical protein [Anaeromyxobacter sp.]
MPSCPPSTRLSLLLLLALASACTTASTQLRVVKPLDRPITARAAAVYPFAFRWEEPPHRSLLFGLATAEALVDGGRLLVFGPDEFLVLRHEADDPRVGTDLLSSLARRSLPATSFLAVRGWAERRVERTSGAIDGAGTVRSSETITFVEHLEVLDGAGGGVLLELEGLAVRQAGATSDPFDPTPELTRLHRELTARAWALLEPHLTAPALDPLPLRLRWLPAAALSWAPPGVRSLAERAATADPLDADLQRLAVYRMTDPVTPDAQLARLMRLPGGLLVEAARPPWSPALQPGDVIVSAAGEAAGGRHVLQRVVALSRSGAVELVVARGAARVPVTVVAR